ncbi:MAG: hypothetical protein QM724_01170 [Flavobacteriales bacterium]
MKKLLLAALLCTGLAFTANAQQGTTQQPAKAGQENTKGHHPHHAKKDGKHAPKERPADKAATKPAATAPARTEPKKK